MGPTPPAPRGVLFFAGPTGVGKTELAKALSRLVFGSENVTRFDMSEFATEGSDARLIGAPPGYVGFEAGGELTNAVRERPFSVLLFDEIEKAHDRVLDKFLQILEDGRLTDGRGGTVEFSEAVIVFTSNLGVVRRPRPGSGGQSEVIVTPRDWERDPVASSDTVLTEIRRFFIDNLGRPELLNRLGNNIVVFGYISPEIGMRILNVQLENVIARLRRDQQIELTIDPRPAPS